MSKNEMSIQMIRKVVLDGFFLGIVIAALAVAGSLWNPFQRGFFCGDESIMYPYRTDTVPVYMLRLCSIGIPVLSENGQDGPGSGHFKNYFQSIDIINTIKKYYGHQYFLICEWTLLRKQRTNVRCFGVPIPTWLRGFYCVTISFALGLCFTELITNITKKVIGRPRPCFLSVCQPSVNCSSPQWQNRYIEPYEFFCKGNQRDIFNDIRMSFLSGHSSMSAYGMIFLAVYLEKRISWNGTRVFRHMLQFAAATLSWYIALSRVSDYKHHWSDVLAGYILGVTIAILMSTCGTDLIKEKKEHLPLPQTEITMANPQHIAIPRQTT